MLPFSFGLMKVVRAKEALRKGLRDAAQKTLKDTKELSDKKTPDTLGTVITETQALTGVEIKWTYVGKGYIDHYAPGLCASTAPARNAVSTARQKRNCAGNSV